MARTLSLLGVAVCLLGTVGCYPGIRNSVSQMDWSKLDMSAAEMNRGTARRVRPAAAPTTAKAAPRTPSARTASSSSGKPSLRTTQQSTPRDPFLDLPETESPTVDLLTESSELTSEAQAAPPATQRSNLRKAGPQSETGLARRLPSEMTPLKDAILSGLPVAAAPVSETADLPGSVLPESSVEPHSSAEKTASESPAAARATKEAVAKSEDSSGAPKSLMLPDETAPAAKVTANLAPQVELIEAPRSDMALPAEPALDGMRSSPWPNTTKRTMASQQRERTADRRAERSARVGPMAARDSVRKAQPLVETSVPTMLPDQMPRIVASASDAATAASPPRRATETQANAPQPGKAVARQPSAPAETNVPAATTTPAIVPRSGQPAPGVAVSPAPAALAPQLELIGLPLNYRPVELSGTLELESDDENSAPPQSENALPLRLTITPQRDRAPAFAIETPQLPAQQLSMPEPSTPELAVAHVPQTEKAAEGDLAPVFPLPDMPLHAAPVSAAAGPVLTEPFHTPPAPPAESVAGPPASQDPALWTPNIALQGTDADAPQVRVNALTRASQLGLAIGLIGLLGLAAWRVAESRRYVKTPKAQDVPQLATVIQIPERVEVEVRKAA